MLRISLAFAALLPLLACGPIPVDQAERQCLESARLAQQPRGTVGIGASSDGRVAGSLELTISSDFIMGRDPADVFNSCVQQKSGQFPSRTLYDQPGWSK